MDTSYFTSFSLGQIFFGSDLGQAVLVMFHALPMGLSCN